MGLKLRASEEQSPDSVDNCDVHGDIPRITYRPFVFTDVRDCRQILVDYWMDVNSVDLSGSTQIESNGVKIDILKVDDKVLQLHEQGIRLQLAILDDRDVIGVLLYRVAFDCVMAIDGLYVYEAFRRHGIGRSLIDSLEKPIKKIIFQTRILKRPHLMFGGLLKMGIEPKKINFAQEKVTWEAEWRQNGRN